MLTTPGRGSGRWRLAGVAGIPGLDDAPVRADGRGWDLAVDGGLVTTLAPSRADAPPLPGDGPSLVLLPLLVDSHDHGRGRGAVAAGVLDQPLAAWLESYAAPPVPSDQETLVGRAAEALVAAGVGAGVLCVNPQGPDVAHEVRTAALAARRGGMRAAVSYPFADTFAAQGARTRGQAGLSTKEVRRELDTVERLADELAAPGTDVQLGPRAPHWVSESTLELIGQHSARTGRRIHMHLLETPAQRAWADATYPEGLLVALDRWQLLTPRTWVAHGVHLRDEELTLLADRGVGLAMNASSNLRLASGFPPLERASTALPRASLGIDGMALSDDHDPWVEMRLAKGLWQAQRHARVSGDEVLALATWRGAAAMGGAAPVVPAPGAVADFVLVDVARVRHLLTMPQWSTADVVVAATGVADVAEVWVLGRQVRCRAHATSP